MAVNVLAVGDLLLPGMKMYREAYARCHSPVETYLVVGDDGLTFIAEHSVIGRIESYMPVKEIGSDIKALRAAFEAHMAVILPEYIFPDEAVIGYEM